MISAEQLRDARLLAGYNSQAALAEALGVSERTVATWEGKGGSVSVRGVAKVMALLWPSPRPELEQYTDSELLLELARRLSRNSI